VVSLYRQAPNIGVNHDGHAQNLYPRVLIPKEKKSIRDLDPEALAADTGHKLFSEYEGLDKYLAAELDAKALNELIQVLDGAAARPRLVSISPLRISFFIPEFLQEFPSFNELVAEAVRSFRQERARTDVASGKRTAAAKLNKLLSRLRSELAEDSKTEEKRIWGELILASIAKITKNADTVTVFNPYTEKEVTIPLNPGRTPQENARDYFKEYKRQKRGRPKILFRIKEIERKLQKIEAGAVLSAVKTGLKPAPKKPEKPKPFREFPLASGSVVYVGKNNRSNDELTFAFARPDDYFFHARGYQGAHTLLKARVPRGQKPAHDDLAAAAGVAAYYSKAKKQKKVPVSYVPRKYVKKNKKGKPGSVILMREEVIFVDPALPEIVLGSDLETRN
jgi:predicted ribosome quality control (RQC) complex YloA/Tae2 family protein